MKELAQKKKFSNIILCSFSTTVQLGIVKCESSMLEKTRKQNKS